MTMRDAAVGTWAWKKKHCGKSPQVYSFSDNGTLMYVFTEDGFITSEEGAIEQISTYKILGESDRVIRARIENEYRKTDDGKLVVWDMVLINDNQFCWHRTDWPSTACTSPMYRCKS